MNWEDFVKTGGIDYSDWFGDGNTLKDAKETVKQFKEEPSEVYLDDYMVLLIFKKTIVVTGYDGNEYSHYFEFRKT